MNIFDKVNNLSESEVLSHVHLDAAAVGENAFVCPVCGHGSHGDGIVPQKIDGMTIWHCYGKCGRHMRNSDLVAAVHGIDSQTDRAGAAKVLSEVFGFSSDDDYGGLYKFCRGNVSKFLAEQGGQFRGFKPTTFTKYGLGVHYEFDFPDGQGKAAALIIPFYSAGRVDKYHFFARSVVDVNGKKLFAQMTKVKNSPPPLYEPLKLTNDGINFVVESATDALSIAQVFDGVQANVGVVAMAGASKVNGFIEKLNRRFTNAERRPRFVIMLDNDKTGADKSRQVVEELRKARYPAVLYRLNNELAGTKKRNVTTGETFTVPKTDANSVLQEGGGKLYGRLVDAISEHDNELIEQAAAFQTAQNSAPVGTTDPSDDTTDSTTTHDTPVIAAKAKENQGERVDLTSVRNLTNVDTKKEIAKAAESALNSATVPSNEQSARAFEQSGVSSVSLGEYFTDKFELDVSALYRYSERKTGFKNLDEKLGAFPPQLVVIGGLPGAGKTTFATQLAQNLAERGETVFYCSYEMSRLELMSKIVARKMFELKRSGRDVIAPTGFEIRRGRVNHLPEFQNVVKDLAASQAQFNVAELSDTTVNKLFEWLKPRILSANSAPVVMIDYLQIIPADKTDRRDRRESLDNTIRSLKNFQREFNCTFIVLSSLNRQAYWDILSLESFKETGSLEFSADLLFGLETCITSGGDRKKQIFDAVRKPERTVKLSCLKNRNGYTFDTYFRYFAAHDYFEPATANDVSSACENTNDDEE